MKVVQPIYSLIGKLPNWGAAPSSTLATALKSVLRFVRRRARLLASRLDDAVIFEASRLSKFPLCDLRGCSVDHGCEENGHEANAFLERLSFDFS